jgi:DNA-binding transcriptional LysR family regulator
VLLFRSGKIYLEFRINTVSICLEVRQVIMPNHDAIKAFVYSADLGSFSAAARKLGKAHSGVSTMIANLEIDCGLTLFDRSGRNPVLTDEGRTLLPHARGILLGNREFLATASSMAEGVETHLCLSIEQGISAKPLTPLIAEFTTKFPSVALEITTPSPASSAALLREGRTDIGLMAEQEGYPSGLQFRGLGYSKMIPVCAPDHPRAAYDQASYRELRQHRQILRHKSPVDGTSQQNEKKSATAWTVENPDLILDFVRSGFGWAELPISLVARSLQAGDLVQLHYAFQQNDLLEGIDLVWTEQRALGAAGQWVRDEVLKLPQTVWQDNW